MGERLFHSGQNLYGWLSSAFVILSLLTSVLHKIRKIFTKKNFRQENNQGDTGFACSVGNNHGLAIFLWHYYYETGKEDRAKTTQTQTSNT